MSALDEFIENMKYIEVSQEGTDIDYIMELARAVKDDLAAIEEGLKKL